MENLRRRLSFDRAVAVRSVERVIEFGTALHEALPASFLQVGVQDHVLIDWVRVPWRGSNPEVLVAAFHAPTASPQEVCSYHTRQELRKQWEFWRALTAKAQLQRVIGTEPLELPASAPRPHYDVAFVTEEMGLAPLLRIVRQERRVLRGSVQLGPAAGEARAGAWLHFRIPCVPGAAGYSLPQDLLDTDPGGVLVIPHGTGSRAYLFFAPRETFLSKVWRLFFLTNTSRYVPLKFFRLGALKLLGVLLARRPQPPAPAPAPALQGGPAGVAGAAGAGRPPPPVSDLLRRPSANGSGGGGPPSSSSSVSSAHEAEDPEARASAVQRFAALMDTEAESRELEARPYPSRPGSPALPDSCTQVALAAASLESREEAPSPPPGPGHPRGATLADRFQQRRRRMSFERSAAARAADEATDLAAHLFETAPAPFLQVRTEDGVRCELLSASWRGRRVEAASVAFCVPVVSPEAVCAFFTLPELRRTRFQRATAASVVEHAALAPGESLEFATDEVVRRSAQLGRWRGAGDRPSFRTTSPPVERAVRRMGKGRKREREPRPLSLPARRRALSARRRPLSLPARPPARPPPRVLRDGQLEGTPPASAGTPGAPRCLFTSKSPQGLANKFFRIATATERYLRGNVALSGRLPAAAPAAAALAGAWLHFRVEAGSPPGVPAAGNGNGAGPGPAGAAMDRKPYCLPESLSESDVKLVLACPCPGGGGSRVLIFWLFKPWWLVRHLTSFLAGRTSRYVAERVMHFLALRICRRLLAAASEAARGGALPGVHAILNGSDAASSDPGASGSEDSHEGTRMDRFFTMHAEIAEVEIAMAAASLRDRPTAPGTSPPTPTRSPRLEPEPHSPYLPEAPAPLLHPPRWVMPQAGQPPNPACPFSGLSAAFATAPRGVLHRASAPPAGPAPSPPPPPKPPPRPRPLDLGPGPPLAPTAARRRAASELPPPGEEDADGASKRPRTSGGP
eukprot:tig00001021_g6309.t1